MVIGIEAQRFKARIIKIHNITIKATSYTSAFVGTPFDSGHKHKFYSWLAKVTNDLGYKPTKEEHDEIARLTTKLDPEKALTYQLYLQSLRNDIERFGAHQNFEDVS